MISDQDRVGIRILREELSVLKLMRVGAGIAWAMARGEPFRALPAVDSENERLSREQIGPAIVLYRALQNVGLNQQEAFRITRRVVLEAGADFLKSTLGPLRRADLEALDDKSRWAMARGLGDRFFNATVRWEAVEPDRVEFTITACRFPALCSAVGASELAPLFCEVDEAYFGSVEPNVRLTRTATIARGAKECPFALEWADVVASTSSDSGDGS